MAKILICSRCSREFSVYPDELVCRKCNGSLCHVCCSPGDKPEPPDSKLLPTLTKLRLPAGDPVYNVDGIPTLLIQWTVDDVDFLIGNGESSLTYDEKIEVLQMIGRKHDANDGVHWDTLRWAITEIIKNRKENQGG